MQPPISDPRPGEVWTVADGRAVVVNTCMADGWPPVPQYAGFPLRADPAGACSEEVILAGPAGALGAGWAVQTCLVVRLRRADLVQRLGTLTPGDLAVV